MAPGIVQANLTILPAENAGDFLRFCQLNPKPCPLIGMTEPGDPMLPVLGQEPAGWLRDRAEPLNKMFKP